jgi:Flavodoxin domain
MTRAIVVYESMYGNTRAVAAAIAAGLGSEAVALPVAQATSDTLAGADLVVVGGPIHAWGMSRPSTRKGAADAANKPGSGLTLEPGAEGPGLREWFATLAGVAGPAAAFDTRMHAPAGMSGSAGRGIARRLRAHGFDLATKPECFYVTKANQLDDGELSRATSWGQQLASLATVG